MGKFNPEHLKANLRMAITRIGILKNKRHNAILAKKDEIANYLRAGNEEMAKINVESIINSENFISALEIIGIMCTQCAERIRVVTESRCGLGSECPRDMLTSVHTLIYAEPYCECQELQKVKEQFTFKYGKSFVRSAQENRENLVNTAVAVKLETRIPEDEIKTVKLEEIAAERHVEYVPKDQFMQVTSIQMLQPPSKGPRGPSGGMSQFPSSAPMSQYPGLQPVSGPQTSGQYPGLSQVQQFPGPQSQFSQAQYPAFQSTNQYPPPKAAGFPDLDFSVPTGGPRPDYRGGGGQSYQIPTQGQVNMGYPSVAPAQTSPAPVQSTFGAPLGVQNPSSFDGSQPTPQPEFSPMIPPSQIGQDDDLDALRARFNKIGS